MHTHTTELLALGDTVFQHLTAGCQPCGKVCRAICMCLFECLVQAWKQILGLLVCTLLGYLNSMVGMRSNLKLCIVKLQLHSRLLFPLS